MRVDAILQSKGARVVTAKPETPVSEVAALLTASSIGALVISRDGHRVDGIVSERDIVRAIARQGKDVLDRRARDIMTTDVITCGRSDHVAEVMAVMTDKRIRHLPVTEGGVLCGIVSIGDVVKSRVEEIEQEARALRDYVTQG